MAIRPLASNKGEELRDIAATNARPPVDIAIIGGGVNGCGIARDAVGRGWSVFLCEKGDLAGATSSAASKLIHGGLRYLEYYEFRLVREALMERETLWRMAPHIILAAALRAAASQGPAPGAGCCGSACSSTIIWGARNMLPPTRTLRSSQRPRRRAA